MQVQERRKKPLNDLLRAIDDCRSINELFALVHREGIVIRMHSLNSASNIDIKPLPENPGVLPLETLKEQVRQAAIDAAREDRKERLIHAVETCPSIDKLFELVKNEHIVIQMKSFSSASNLPQQKPPEKPLKPDTAPLDRLKKQVMQAVNDASRDTRKEQLIRAVETCPSIDKLFELVKNEHIVIQMKSFSSASNLPQQKLPEPPLNPDTSPLDRLREQVIQAVNDTPTENRTERLIREVEAVPTIDKLFELVKNEHIEIRMKSFSSASNLPQHKPSGLPLKPDKSPLDRLKEQVLEAVIDASPKHTKAQIIRAVETVPTIDKLFKLVKNEHIMIPMTSFSSASNLPQQKLPELPFIPEKSPLDRLKEKVIEAIKHAN